MKHPRRTIAALLCALAVALGVMAPSVARATDEAPYITQLGTIDACPECNGLSHTGVGIGMADGGYMTYSVVPTVKELFDDPTAVIDSIEVEGDSVTVKIIEHAGLSALQADAVHGGTTTAVVRTTDGRERDVKFEVIDYSNRLDELVDVPHYATLVVDDLLPDALTIQTSWGETRLPYSYTSSDATSDRPGPISVETTCEVADPSILTVANDGLVTPLKAGTTDVTMTITDRAHPEVSATDTITVTVIDDGDTPADPFAEDGMLLPYTIENGVMTFDGRPDLGEWYQLDLDLGEGVTSTGLTSGGSMWTMTITADMLDEDDPLFSATGYLDGPFFVRGDNHGAYTNLAFDYPADKALSFRLDGSGTVESSGDNGFLLVQLSGPATLRASLANETVITNEQGASVSHKPSGDDWSTSDGFWSSLTLVTDHLGGDVAQTATDSVVAAIDGVTGHPYVFDIHLEDMLGDVFEIPEGDSVTVTLPIPEGLSAEGLHVFHVADDGTVTDMNATVDAEAGTVSFMTTHFSTFVLANVAADDSGKGAGEKTDGLAKTGDASALPALLTAVSGGAALLGGRALRRRR